MNGIRLKPVWALLLVLSIATAVTAQETGRLAYSEQVFDFGHVGIEFRVFRTYSIVNETDQVVRITEIDPSCDCSSIGVSDSVMAPGDTVYFYLDFNTRDAYGPVTRSFTVKFENGPRPEMKFFYISSIGLWPKGLKPNPISVFFLPGRSQQEVVINNSVYKNLEISMVEQAHDFFDVEFNQTSASRGDRMTMVVHPKASLAPGTHYSSYTIQVSGDGLEKPVSMTIPIKIAKY